MQKSYFLLIFRYFPIYPYPSLLSTYVGPYVYKADQVYPVARRGSIWTTNLMDRQMPQIDRQMPQIDRQMPKIDRQMPKVDTHIPIDISNKIC